MPGQRAVGDRGHEVGRVDGAGVGREDLRALLDVREVVDLAAFDADAVVDVTMLDGDALVAGLAEVLGVVGHHGDREGAGTAVGQPLAEPLAAAGLGGRGRRGGDLVGHFLGAGAGLVLFRLTALDDGDQVLVEFAAHLDDVGLRLLTGLVRLGLVADDFDGLPILVVQGL